MKFETFKMAWGMMSPYERRMSWVVLLAAIFGAFAQICIIGSVMPFLDFVSNGYEIDPGGLIAYLQNMTGISEKYRFAIFLGIMSMTVIWICNFVLLVRGYVLTRFTTMRVHTLSVKLLNSYLNRDYEYFIERNSKDLTKRMLAETSEISNSFLRPMADFVSSSLSAIGIVGLLLFMEPVGTMIGSMSVLVVYLGINAISAKLQDKLGKIRIVANKDRFQIAGEIFDGIKAVKVSSLEESYSRSFEKASKKALETVWKSRVIAESPQHLIQTFFLSGIIVACLILLDPGLMNEGKNGLNSMISLVGMFALAGLRIMPELNRAYAANSRIGFGAAAIENVYEDFGTRQIQKIKPINIGSFEEIEFRNVDYRYPNSDKGPKNVSFKISKGERIGIVGGTGSGKTTIVDLALGLLFAYTGAVRVNGLNLNDRGVLSSWREKTAYVPQEVFLTDGTIAANIAFGAEEIEWNWLRKCARIAQIDDFIENQAIDGYQSVIGEKGVMLSGGQRQRIGIARALYKGAEFIVMDEATSALDPETERKVMEAIEREIENVAIIFIAHRLGTVRQCDRLIVLDRGEIVEIGTWEELIQKDGVFKELATSYEE